MPKVTIIIPVYDVEKYIERCTRSLFEQTLDDIEYIFVNDCTPDNSIVILERILDEYPHRKELTKIVNMPTNQGQSAVRRKGIQLSTGQYIIHCDSDDWMELDMCQKLYSEAVLKNADIVFCDYYRSSDTERFICKNICKKNEDNDSYLRKLLIRDCFTSVWNKLVKNEIAKYCKIDYPECNMWEDYVLCVQYFYYSNKICYVDTPLYNYYHNVQSICFKDPGKKQSQIIHNSKILLDFLEKVNLLEKYKYEIICLKNTAREELLPHLGLRKYRNMWLNTYPEINKQYIWNPIVSIKDKVKFALIHLCIYPILLYFKKKLSKS